MMSRSKFSGGKGLFLLFVDCADSFSFLVFFKENLNKEFQFRFSF